jgi:thioredoxin-like negative regulator of GroEL
LLVYFSGVNCNVCKVLQPKITSSFKKHYPLITQVVIEIEKYPNIAGQFNVFTAPTIVIYFDKKEIKRKSRNLSVQQLLQEIQRPYELYFGS